MSFYKKTIKDIPIEHRRILLRADYNVPLDEMGEIDNDFRLTQSLPTLRYLLRHDCAVVICSHLGRPKGKVNEKYSLEKVAKRLSRLLGQEVFFASDCVGDRVYQATKRLRRGQVMVLENLRFHPEEEANDEAFAKRLARDSNARYFVQDGFGVVHRAHASTEAITHYLPSVAGLLIKREYDHILGAMRHTKEPLVAVLGGAKISDKIGVIEQFIHIADTIIIGGAMANTFLKYRGYDVGKSIVEDGLDSTLRRIYDAAIAKVGIEKLEEFMLLPIDVAIAHEISENAKRQTKKVESVASNEFILDLGEASIDRVVAHIEKAATVVWNGTLGFAEFPQFAHGSARVAMALAQNAKITSVIGGGDTADFVLSWDAQNGKSFTHVSTGGGASLELMAGKKLPGVEALLNA